MANSWAREKVLHFIFRGSEKDWGKPDGREVVLHSRKMRTLAIVDEIERKDVPHS